MKAFRLLHIFIVVIALANGANAQVSRIGSGTCLKFPGTSVNQHVDLDTIANTFATSDFTVEFWEKLDTSTTTDSDIPFICNKDWANGANKGFVISKMSNPSGGVPSLWVNFTTQSGSRFDRKNIPCPTLMTAWTHIAVSFDRSSSNPKVIIYVNGIPADSASFTSAHAPTSSIVGTQHTRLAQDGTGAYSWGFKYNGYMDEMRIWKGVRTADQVRTYMCRKLTGAETNLLAYYNFNDATGTTLRNLVSGRENGTLRNMSGTSTDWALSGAAIGDTSIFNYGSTLTSSTMQLGSASNGTVKVNGITGPAGGIQIYRVDTVPNTYNGISTPGGGSAYFGVFEAQRPVASTSATPVTFNVTYDYSGYAAATSAATNVKLYNRYGNNYGTWAMLDATNNTTAYTFVDSNLNFRREFLVGDFSSVSCANPTGVYSDSASATFMRVKWAAAGGSQWQVQYGLQGFQLGTGMSTSVSGSPVANLTGLTNANYYDVYVRRICGSGDTSKWTGPMTGYAGFNCPMVSGVTITQLGGDSVLITWTANTSSIYNMQWGLAGFALGTGIPVNNISTNRYVIHGLSVGGTYELYLKDSCIGQSSSAWNGPISFTNTGRGVAVSGVPAQTSEILLFPNPANDQFTLQYNVQGAVAVSIYTMQGRLVQTENIVASPSTINVAMLAPGMYMVEVQGNDFSTHKTIVINR